MTDYQNNTKMIKRISELNREEKILLLQAFENHEIERKVIGKNTFCATEYSDYFLGMIISGSQEKTEDTETVIICLGPARQAREYMQKIGSIEVVNGDGEITEILKMTKDNFV